MMARSGQAVRLFAFSPYHSPRLKDIHFNEAKPCARHPFKLYTEFYEKDTPSLELVIIKGL